MEKIKKEEVAHLQEVLKTSQIALIRKDSIKLKELSDQTIHTTSIHQHRGLITITVIIYALSKMVERQDYKKIKNWASFTKKLNKEFSHAIVALKKDNLKLYDQSILQARKILEAFSGEFKQYIKEVITKASINKGGKLYEHGLSLEKTAHLLGISQWELNEYAGTTMGKTSARLSSTIKVKDRAKMALEFFQ